MHKIEFANITWEFPESISEMTEAQYRYFSFLEMNRQLGKMSMEELETLFVYFAMEMDHETNGRKAVENVTRLRELVQPYFTGQKSKKSGKQVKIVDLNFFENPLPVIEIKGKKYIGPSTVLQDCSYEEVFVHAQNALLDFSNTLEEEYLDRLVAILYRPKKRGNPWFLWSKKRKPVFNAEEVDERIEDIKTLQPEIKFGVYLFFASCQKFITTAEALDIGGGNTVNIAQLFKPDPSQGKGKGIGSVGLIYSLAESGVFGNARETGRHGVYDILSRMVQLHEQAKEMEKNAKRK